MKPLAARVAGVVRSPRRTFTELAALSTPPWLDVLVTTTVATFLALAALFATPTGRIALVDQWERTAVAFGQPVDDALYARLQALSGQGVWYAAGLAVLTGPVLTLLLATGLKVVWGRGAGRGASWSAFLTVAAHGSVILALRQVISVPVNYVSETLTSPTTLSLFLSATDETSPLARFAGAVDLLVLWWLVVIAIGVSAVTGRPSRTAALAFAGVYALVALVLAAAMAIAGSPA